MRKYRSLSPFKIVEFDRDQNKVRIRIITRDPVGILKSSISITRYLRAWFLKNNDSVQYKCNRLQN